MGNKGGHGGAYGGDSCGSLRILLGFNFADLLGQNRKSSVEAQKASACSCDGSSLRALVEEGRLTARVETEERGDLTELVVARAHEVVGLLDGVVEVDIAGELFAGEVDGDDELPGLVGEGITGALEGVETLDLVGGQILADSQQGELDGESEEGDSLTGPLLGLKAVSVRVRVGDINGNIGAIGVGHTLEALEGVEGE